MLEYDALRATPLETDPFPHVVVPSFVPRERLGDVLRDFPRIDAPGPRGLDSLVPGPEFEKLIETLLSPEFSEAVGGKLRIDLASAQRSISVRGHCQASDGAIHTDSWTKIATALLYFEPEWPHEAGRLRLLRDGRDIGRYAAEVEPSGGTLLLFARGSRSWHGHLPCEGQRRMLQFSWLHPSYASKLVLEVKRWSTRWIKRLHLDRPSHA